MSYGEVQLVSEYGKGSCQGKWCRVRGKLDLSFAAADHFPGTLLQSTLTWWVPQHLTGNGYDELPQGQLVHTKRVGESIVTVDFLPHMQSTSRANFKSF